MADTWLITQKPTFLTEWMGLPPKESHQVLEKINLLLQDPTPDAKVKKQLKYMGGKLHRLRAGRYRIFYTFEFPYVSLLALRQRDDNTYDEDIDPEFLGGLDPDLTGIAQPQQPDWEKIFAPQADPKTPLPEPITAELLNRLRIPETCHPRLLQIEDREALFDCPGIPDEIILKLDEYLFERPLVDVLQQPDLIARDTSDLLRFKEGDLLGFLLKLNPEQEKFVTWATNAKGPTLLKGGPGTGKSTVAIYRTREILERLRAEGVQSPNILFTIYTNALVKFSQQLLKQLLGDDIHHVEVKTADSRMYSLRAGRIVPLNRIQRQAIWHLREHINQRLAEQGLETWEQLRNQRRTLFVGMTRAMRALLVVVPETKPSTLLQGFDKTLWNLGKTTA